MNSNEIIDLLQEVMNFNPSTNKKVEVSKEFDENSVKLFDNNKLCSIVASNRYLKMDPKMEKLCMKELAERRASGDTFLFENQIEKYYKSFTPINKKIPEISELIGKFRDE